jgi:hypothetical protein
MKQTSTRRWGNADHPFPGCAKSRTKPGIAVVGLRADIGNPTTTEAGAGLAIGHNVLRDALMDMLGIPPAGTEAIGARLKTLLGLGLRRQGEQAPGRGRGHRNCLADALDAALAFTLQRAFVPPSAVVDLVVVNRTAIDAYWAAAARGVPVSISVEIDALTQVGREGMRTGRFSENASGCLTLIDPAKRCRSMPRAPAPRVTVDLTELYGLTTDSLRRAGVGRAALGAAEARIGALTA